MKSERIVKLAIFGIIVATCLIMPASASIVRSRSEAAIFEGNPEPSHHNLVE
jgi:hypothetical protein